MESELFGHERGAFTGALRQKAGRFEQADGGTVFLDEIGEVSPQVQIKLLRVLQTQTFERLGGERQSQRRCEDTGCYQQGPTERGPKGQLSRRSFLSAKCHSDQYCRPLENAETIFLYWPDYFLKRFSSEQGKNIQEFSSEARRILWTIPGPAMSGN